MDGLRTSSVLILDDNDEEALQIQRSLAGHGIGAIFVSGAPDSPPHPKMLTGIRVAILDIRLGLSQDPKAEIQHTINLIKQIIHPNNGPYLAVIWTANSEDFDDFVNGLRKLACPPVDTIQLYKPAILSLENRKDIAQAILDNILAALDKLPALKFLTLWEQIIWSAANETVVSLHQAVPSQSEDQEVRTEELRAQEFLTALLESEASKELLAKQPEQEEVLQDAARALLTALNSLHIDRVMQIPSTEKTYISKAVRPIYNSAVANISSKSNQLSMPDRAKINTAMLFDHSSVGLSPGSIYNYKKVLDHLEHRSILPGQGDIIKSIVEESHAEHAEDFPVVILEITARCDHQQGKLPVARFLAGMLFESSVSESKSKAKPKPRKAQYLYSTAPLRIPGLLAQTTDVVMVWSYHYPVSIPADSIQQLEPIGRLREPLLADIRSWLAYQSSRPGYPSLR